MTVFPDRNLPDEAQNWGRHVENRVLSGEAALREVDQTSNNGARFSGGQLAVFQRLVDEQSARSVILTRVPDISVTGNATAEPFPSTTQMISVGVPPGARAAQVEVYGIHDNPNAGNVALFAYLSYNGQIISRLRFNPDTDELLIISGSPLSVFGLANIILPETGPANFSLTIIRRGVTSTVTTETLRDIRLYVTPFQSTV